MSARGLPITARGRNPGANERGARPRRVAQEGKRGIFVTTIGLKLGPHESARRAARPFGVFDGIARPEQLEGSPELSSLGKLPGLLT